VAAATTSGAPYLGAGADVDGDGFSDFGSTLTVETAGQNWPTRVALIQFGSRAGFTRDSALVNVITDYFPLWVGNPVGIGDFDGDGFGEMLVTTREGALMLRGCGPGPASVPWGSLGCGNCQLQEVATGDFNGDGRSDVIYADGTGITLYPGNPDAIAPIGIRGAGGVSVLDFNYDGYSDLVLGSSSSTLIEGHEGGPAGLSPTVSPAAQPLPFLLAGDFDGDGYWDLIGPACASQCPSTMSVGYGGPAGWGAPFERTSPLDRSVSRAAATIVDLNADGYDDLLVDGPGDGVTAWYAGSPSGLATSPSKVIAK
jgi:hypothetical protein